MVDSNQQPWALCCIAHRVDLWKMFEVFTNHLKPLRGFANGFNGQIDGLWILLSVHSMQKGRETPSILNLFFTFRPFYSHWNYFEEWIIYVQYCLTYILMFLYSMQKLVMFEFASIDFTRLQLTFVGTVSRLETSKTNMRVGLGSPKKPGPTRPKAQAQSPKWKPKSPGFFYWYIFGVFGDLNFPPTVLSNDLNLLLSHIGSMWLKTNKSSLKFKLTWIKTRRKNKNFLTFWEKIEKRDCISSVL